MRPTGTVLGSFSLVVLGLLSGCAQVENPRTLVPSEPSVEDARSIELRRYQFDDIPVPAGFEHVTRGNRTFAYQKGGVRVGRFVYWGKDSVEDTVEFYRRNMPLRAFDWKLINEEATEAGHYFEYSKGKQACKMSISRSVQGTYVEVEVAGSA